MSGHHDLNRAGKLATRLHAVQREGAAQQHRGFRAADTHCYELAGLERAGYARRDDGELGVFARRVTSKISPVSCTGPAFSSVVTPGPPASCAKLGGGLQRRHADLVPGELLDTLNRRSGRLNRCQTRDSGL